MLLAKWHRRALQSVKMLSTLRRQQATPRFTDEISDILDAPSIPSQWSAANSDSVTRFVCMSDTHGKHRDITFVPKGDVLIHAGDFTKYGETTSVRDLSSYFHDQKESNNYQEILCIAGNHDMTFHKDYYEKTWSRHIRSHDSFDAKEALQHCTYLEDSTNKISNHGDDKIDNNSNNSIEVYGSPWTPNFFKWAFNLSRGEALQEVWSQIPTTTDVLITHGPPQGRGDMTLHSGHFGCLDLLHEVQTRVKPRLHVYGHIHEGYGTSFDGHTLYVNASSLDLSYEATNPCIVVDVPHDASLPAVVVTPQCTVSSAAELVDWLREKRYNVIAEIIQQVQPQTLPMTNDLLAGSTAYHTICDQLMLKRKDRIAKTELRNALCQLYAESF